MAIFVKATLSCVLLLVLSTNARLQTSAATKRLEPKGEQKLAVSSRQNYEGHYLYLGGYPDERLLDWSEEAQGLAHDRDYWYITQRDRLWRIPVLQDLTTVKYGSSGVRTFPLNSYGALARFNHLGDLVHYEFRGHGYLIVPLVLLCRIKG